MNIKHSDPSSIPYKVWGNFFRKKALHGGTNFFWANLYGDVLHWD